MKYNEEADKFLTELYQSVGAVSDMHKFNLLNMMLGGSVCFSHTPSDAQKVSILEYELPQKYELIELTLA